MSYPNIWLNIDFSNLNFLDPDEDMIGFMFRPTFTRRGFVRTAVMFFTPTQISSSVMVELMRFLPSMLS